MKKLIMTNCTEDSKGHQKPCFPVAPKTVMMRDIVFEDAVVVPVFIECRGTNYFPRLIRSQIGSMIAYQGQYLVRDRCGDYPVNRPSDSSTKSGTPRSANGVTTEGKSYKYSGSN
jgi:hypothetical protein